MRFALVLIACMSVATCSPPRTEAPVERQAIQREEPTPKRARQDTAARDVSPTAFSYQIVEHTTPDEIRGDSTVAVLVKVRNTSNRLWTKNGPIRIGLYWMDSQGKRIEKLEGRGPLPKDTPPGATAHIRCRLKAPSQPGRYRLTWDMVEEKVGWFGSRGGTPTRTTVIVR